MPIYLDGHAKWVDDRGQQVSAAGVDFANNYNGAGSQNWYWNNFFGE